MLLSGFRRRCGGYVVAKRRLLVSAVGVLRGVVVPRKLPACSAHGEHVSGTRVGISFAVNTKVTSHALSVVACSMMVMFSGNRFGPALLSKPQ